MGITGEMVRTWKEAVQAYLRYYPGICLEKIRKTMKNLKSG
jgi:hypothetical protein